jgi:Uma2 family endonuclease
MSLQDFDALGEVKHHEWYAGLCVVNPRTRRHARAVNYLQRLIEPACPPTHEVLVGWGWEASALERFEPDLMITDRSAPDTDMLRLPPPLLVVEVCSPSTRADDWGTKRLSYGGAGAAWYWIVDLDVPEIVFLRNEGGELVEVGRYRARTTAPGPVVVEVDLRALATL